MASITDIIKEGLKYPFNDTRKVLILGLIFLISGLISLFTQYVVYDSMTLMVNASPYTSVNGMFASIPPSNSALIFLSWIVTFILFLFTSGYIYDVIKYAIDGRYELPDFGNIFAILKNGLRTLIVGIVYSIVPALIFILGLMLMVNEASGEAVNMFGLILLFVSFIVAIFIYLIEVIAISHMVENDSLKSAFQFSEIFDIISNMGWGRFIGALIFAFIVIAIISMFFGMIFGAISTGIGILFDSALVSTLVSSILTGLLLSPYISIALGRMFGSVYKEAISK